MTEFKLQPADILIKLNPARNLGEKLEKCAVGPYSHVYMYMGNLGLFTEWRQGRIQRVPMIFESNGRGVCLRLISERYGEEVVVLRLRESYDRRRIPYIWLAAIKLASDEQSRYDYACIPLHIIPRILHEKLGIPIPLKYHRNQEQVCSEAVNEAFIRSKVRLLYHTDVPLPGDFAFSPLLEDVWHGILSANILR